MKKNILGTVAIALASIAATAPAPTVTVNEGAPTQQTQKANKDQSAKVNVVGRQYVRDNAGGFDVMSYGIGIDPKTYGERYVRRGTHKRSNKA